MAAEATHSTLIRRAYITLGDRQIHVRHAGSGDPVVLIHQSPTSARTLDAQTEGFARAGFHAIAIDMPGLGRSDPIGLPQPEIADLAAALGEFLDAIGLTRVALYGSHTGALICVDFAVRHPERVSAVLIDGYPIYTPGERDRRVATYFPPYAERWDGTHLLWLWSRYREQYLFWPWNVPGISTQARCDVPDPVYLHEGVIDMLRVGNAYRMPYSAAFRCVSDALLREVRVPTYFLAYPDDSLTQALALLAPLPDACRVEAMPAARADGVAHEIALLRRHPAGRGAASLHTTPRDGGITRGYITVDTRQLAVRSCGGASSRALVVIPPVPGSGSMLAAELELLGRSRRVIAIDAPGSGDSDAWPAIDPSSAAQTIGEALDEMGIKQFDLFALHGGCAPAIELAAARAANVGRIVLESPAGGYPTTPAFLEQYAPPIVPRWSGSHLIELWHATRNRRLFRPWFDERLAVRHTDFAAIEPDTINREVLAYLESWRTYHAAWAAVLSYPIAEAVARLGAKVSVASRSGDEFAPFAERLGQSIEWLPDAVTPRTQRILACIAPN